MWIHAKDGKYTLSELATTESCSGKIPIN